MIGEAVNRRNVNTMRGHHVAETQLDVRGFFGIFA
jgi:hypothetical protein